MDSRTVLGQRLQQIREAFGLNQNELANIAKVSRQQISGIEKGDKKPSFELLEALFLELKVNHEWFFRGCGKMLIDNVVEEDRAIQLRKIYKVPFDVNLDQVLEKMENSEWYFYKIMAAIMEWEFRHEKEIERIQKGVGNKYADSRG